MKKLSLFALAAAAMLFAACSSEKDVADNSPQQNVFEENGVGYFKVNINLPTVPTTRATTWLEDSQLDDGDNATLKEYNVKTAMLLIFTGPNEEDATLAQVKTLTSAQALHAPANGQVTTTGDYVVQLTASTTDNYYALAVLNYEGVIEPGSEVDKVTVNGATQKKIKLSDLYVAIAANADGSTKFVDADGNIFMMNALLSDVRGGKNDPTAAPASHVLVELDKSFIYETQAQASAAEAKPAADIYVERGVAKVTVNDAMSLGQTALKRHDGTTLAAVEFLGWYLTTTNKSSYIAHKKPAEAWNLTSFADVSTSDAYRFVGNTPVDAEFSTATAGYRVYWAEDPNYADDLDAAGKAAAFYITAPASLSATAIGNTHPQYCYENTFDVAHQSYQYTTSAIVKVKLNGGAEFFTIGADRKTLYTEGDIETIIKNNLIALSDFNTWADLTAPKGLTTTLTADKLTVNWSTTDAGAVTINDITIDKTITKSGADVTVSSIDTDESYSLLSTIQAQVSNIKRYKGGETYYAIRIQHFGDALTPWNDGEYYSTNKPAESTIDAIYPDAGATASEHRQAANYLGRYGVVRNNWYDITLKDVLKIGAATPDELNVTDHPDDNLEDAYIKTRINVLSWAKRPQSWDLK